MKFNITLQIIIVISVLSKRGNYALSFWYLYITKMIEAEQLCKFYELLALTWSSCMVCTFDTAHKQYTHCILIIYVNMPIEYAAMG